MKKVFVVEWEEFEEGWGPRSDGYSIHTSESKMKAYKDRYGAPTGGIHSSMPLREFEVNDPKLYAIARSKGGSAHVARLVMR